MTIHKKPKYKKYDNLPTELVKLGIKPYMLYDDRYFNVNDDLHKYDENVRKEREEYRKKWGFHYQILWDLGLSIAVDMYIKLTAFKKLKRYSVPSEFENDVKGWEETLDKMINAFKLIIEQDYSINLPSGEPKSNEELGFIDTHHLIDFDVKDCIFNTNKLSDEDKEELEKRKDKYYKKLEEENKQIKEGLELFAKYLRTLWD